MVYNRTIPCLYAIKRFNESAERPDVVVFKVLTPFVLIRCDSKNNRLYRTCVHRVELKPAMYIHLRWYINARRTWARFLRLSFDFSVSIWRFLWRVFFPRRFFKPSATVYYLYYHDIRAVIPFGIAFGKNETSCAHCYAHNKQDACVRQLSIKRNVIVCTSNTVCFFVFVKTKCFRKSVGPPSDSILMGPAVVPIL